MDYIISRTRSIKLAPPLKCWPTTYYCRVPKRLRVQGRFIPLRITSYKPGQLSSPDLTQSHSKTVIKTHENCNSPTIWPHPVPHCFSDRRSLQTNHHRRSDKQRSQGFCDMRNFFNNGFWGFCGAGSRMRENALTNHRQLPRNIPTLRRNVMRGEVGHRHTYKYVTNWDQNVKTAERHTPKNPRIVLWCFSAKWVK